MVGGRGAWSWKKDSAVENRCVPSELGKESFEGGGGGVYEEWQGEQRRSLPGPELKLY